MIIASKRSANYRKFLYILSMCTSFVLLPFYPVEIPRYSQTPLLQQNNDNKSNHELILSFVGTWVSADGSYLEEWETDDDTLLAGAGYALKNGSKMRSEAMSIISESTGYYYLAKVAGQNEGKTIAFGPAIFLWQEVIFENKLHDFPNLLRYTFQNDSILLVSVESHTDASMNFQVLLKKETLH